MRPVNSVSLDIPFATAAGSNGNTASDVPLDSSLAISPDTLQCFDNRLDRAAGGVATARERSDTRRLTPPSARAYRGVR